MNDPDPFDDPNLFDDGNGPGPDLDLRRAPCPHCGTVVDIYRRDVQTGTEHTVEVCLRLARLRDPAE